MSIRILYSVVIWSLYLPVCSGYLYGQKEYVGNVEFHSLEDIVIDSNLQDGCYEARSQEGTLIFEGIIALGKPVDIVTFYYKTGEPKFILPYSSMGKLSGTALHLTNEGAIIEKRIYSMDTLVESTTYGTEGGMTKWLFLPNDIKIHWSYANCATILSKSTFHGDKLSRIESYENGKLVLETLIYNGDSTLERKYSEDGYIKLAGTVIEGKRSGTWYEYNRKGEKIKAIFYNRFGGIEKEEELSY